MYFIKKTNGQSLVVNPIQSKNVYLIFKTGTINLPFNYEHHYLTVNLTKIENTFNYLMKQAKEFKTFSQIQYSYENKI